MIELRPMVEGDLPLIGGWLLEPHVARWWTADSGAEAELADYRRLVAGDDPSTVGLVVVKDREPIGWCQWYLWSDYPDEARAMGAAAGEVGIDYAIGDQAEVGHGLGTEMIGVLVSEVRRHQPGAGLLAAPEAANIASRRVLEHQGFELVEVRPVDVEPHRRPMAIYRLAP
jgi:aminoglycoside 6'-N-acetyltransferase